MEDQTKDALEILRDARIIVEDAHDYIKSRYSLEEKIVEAFDRPLLSDGEIAEVVEWALGETSSELGTLISDHGFVDEIYDIIYEAIEKAIGRIKS